MKKIATSVLFWGSWINANALVITAENETVCPNEGVILNSSLASTSSVTWQKKVNGAWVNASTEGSQLKVGVPFIYEMDDHDVEFRAVEKSGTNIIAESNVVKITKGTDCVPECHSSATGDFITGTDFDPTGKNTGKLENDVENFFGEYTLEFSKNDCPYSIGGLQSSFGSYVPSIDDEVRKKTEGKYENYFMNLTNPNCKVVTISFPANPSVCENGYNHHGLSYRNQHYRFVMRAYVKPTCKLDGNAAFRARTGHGTVTDDRMDVELYDDVTGTLLGSKRDLQSANNVAEVKFSSLTNVGNLPMSGGDYHMLRFEMTFYGYMPYVNEGLKHYEFTSEFALLSCAKVSIDYISAEVEKVCLSPKLVCKGEIVRATATGFPKNATYNWYERSGNGWAKVFGASGKGDEYRTANIYVDFVGAKEYKVEVNKGDGSATVTKEFTVYGKECDPIWPNEIIGSGMVCAPKDDNIYYVDPVSEDETVFYRWKLITPSKKEVYNNTVYEGAGLQEDSKTKGASVRVIFPSVAEHGKYILEAQVVRRTVVDGATVENPIGTPIQKIIDVHNTPTLKLSLSSDRFASGTEEQDKILCPSNMTNKVYANVDITNKESEHRYVYTWTGATASTKSSSSAEVIWDRDAACDGTFKSHDVSATVEIDGVGCPATIKQTYKYEKPEDPTIDCSKINGLEIPLGETEKTTTIGLPLPTYSVGCDPNPKMTIEVVVKDVETNVLKGTNQSRTIEFSMSQTSTINKKVVAPAGTIEVKYTITDGCGKSESCDAVLKVKNDTFNISVLSNDDRKGKVYGGGRYFQGDSLRLIAVPDTGFKFVGWMSVNGFSVRYAEGADTIIGIFDKDTTYHEPILDTIPETQKADTLNISVLSNDDRMGKVYGGGRYSKGDTLRLIAVPDTGYKFVGWMSVNGYSVRYVEGNDTIIGIFDKDTTYQEPILDTVPETYKTDSFNISVLSNDDRKGKVYGGGRYSKGDTLRLIAVPDTGYRFVGWMSVNGFSVRYAEGNDTIIGMFDIDTTHQEPIFDTIPETQKADTLNISVLSNDDRMGKVYGGGRYSKGDTLRLIAVPDTGYRFVGWISVNGFSVRYVEGADTIIGIFDKDTTYQEPIFDTIPETQKTDTLNISVLSNDDRMGKVYGGGRYSKGDTLRLIAVPDTGYRFVGWISVNGFSVRYVEGADTIIGIFDKDTTYQEPIFDTIPETQKTDTLNISVLSNDDRIGKVYGGGKYSKGDTLRLIAVPDTGYRFVGWISVNGFSIRYAEGNDTIIGMFDIDTTYHDSILDTVPVIVPRCVYIEALSSDSLLGITKGTNLYQIGDTAIIEAIAYDNANFIMWNDGETQSKRLILCDTVKSYIAIFEKKEITDLIMNVSNADPIVDVCTVEGYVLKSNVRLSEALINLKRGFYIIGGKKYYISK